MYLLLTESLHHLHVSQGLQWFLLAEDEIASRIVAMVGRRSHGKRSELQSTPKVPGVRYLHPVGENNLQYTNDAKLMRKLKAQGQFICQKYSSNMSCLTFSCIFSCVSVVGYTQIIMLS